MARYSCPVCGDPNAYPLWIDSQPPDRCPHDPVEWPGTPSVKSICPTMMARARQSAQLRKAAPDCFDAMGNMIPEKAGEAWVRWPKPTRT